MVTTSQVKRAGQVLRKWSKGEMVDMAQVYRARAVLLEFRAAHRLPLTTANMGLRSMVRTEGCRVEVSQRLKRVPTIIEKLVRQPTMQLSNMQDIGGVRAIVDSTPEIRRVQRRLSHLRPVLRVNDYVDKPKASGYRSVHVVVEYRDRAIEVQLRTPVMHDWAVAVERFGGRIGADLKSGIGPQEVLDWLEAVSEAMALEEEGSVVDSDLVDRIGELRAAALPFLAGGPR